MSGSRKAIRWETEGDVIVVSFTSDHIADELYVQQARKELRSLANTVAGKMIVSLENVKFMASAGLGILVELHKLRQRANAQLKICDMRPLIRQTFTSAKIDRVLGIYDSKEEAMAAFEEEGEATTQ